MIIWSHFILKQLPNPQRSKAMCEAPAHRDQARPVTPLGQVNPHGGWCTLSRVGLSRALQPWPLGIFLLHMSNPGALSPAGCSCAAASSSLQKQRGFQMLFHFIYLCKRLLFIAEAAQLHSSAKLHPPISLLVPRSLDVKPACELLLM